MIICFHNFCDLCLVVADVKGSLSKATIWQDFGQKLHINGEKNRTERGADTSRAPPPPDPPM